MPSTVDLVLVLLTILLPVCYLYRESLPIIGGKSRSAPAGFVDVKKRAQEDDGDPRDFVEKMKKGNKRCVMFYGSQTGTAEEYAIRLAKEAKSRFGVSSLVCDPEEYDFTHLDKVPSDCCVFFVMATYGEGEPTDNAQPMMEYIMDDSVEFSEGGDKLENLNYVVFGLGNKTYEYYNEIARKVDKRMVSLGAKRIGTVGEGDDDKSMEEDYLAWKDGMWEAFSAALGVEEGGGGDVADFTVTELPPSHPQEKVYHGELSARALLTQSGTSTPVGATSYDAKNPYPAPVITSRELFNVGSDRNCVHVEFDITGANMAYQHGDHVGVWPSNPDCEVDRILSVLGLASEERRHAIVAIESLDPALAKVPFPQPATYEAIFRHYLDISATASRQTLGLMARFAPTPEIAGRLAKLGSDKEAYHAQVAGPALKLAEVLQAVAGDDLSSPHNVTAWPAIPFDRIVSMVPRLQPRYYSISSSSKLHPSSIHVTAVILKYQSTPSAAHKHEPRWVFGVGTNFILNVKMAAAGELLDGKGDAQLVSEPSVAPKYKLGGPRSAYVKENIYRVPIHVRRSTFRLPTSPKVPVIMIGPGTGVAPFRGFVQERVALARRAIAKSGPDALKDWAPMHLFYGCRQETEDFLYRDEWPEYAKELGSAFQMHCAFSRGEKRKPDGGKIYVQDLLWDMRAVLAPLILEKRAYVYICGDAKNMSKAVEDRLVRMLAEAKGGSPEVEGARELKLLKERNRLMSDVWS